MKSAYKEFSGRFKKSANHLIEDMKNEGYSPLSISEFMKIKLLDEKEFYWGSTNTIDAAVSNKNGDTKFILDSEHLKNMNYQTPIPHPQTSLPFAEEDFERFSGSKILYVPRETIFKLSNVKLFYDKEEIKDSPELNFVAKDHKLLEDYIEFILPKVEKEIGVRINEVGLRLFGNLGSFNGLKSLSLGGLQLGSADLFNGTNHFVAVKDN